MDKNINIAKILKDAPKGTKLWSPMLGDCYFEEYQERESTYPIRVRFTNYHKENNYHSLSVYGKAVEVDSAECVLFPSKDNRDWATFKAPWRHKYFEPFQQVLIKRYRLTGPAIWGASYYSHYVNNAHYTTTGKAVGDDDIISYRGNEDKLGKPVE